MEPSGPVQAFNGIVFFSVNWYYSCEAISKILSASIDSLQSSRRHRISEIVLGLWAAEDAFLTLNGFSLPL